VLLWTSNYAWWAAEVWIFARDLRHARGRSADRFSRLVIVGAIIFSISAASWFAGLFPFAKLPDGNIGAIRFAGGIACKWIGLTIRVWAVLALGRYFRTIVMVQEDHRLVTSGLYARVRNPS
jgi:protein-S-isoprenylcysteine O-methyltransferase Ste14